MFEQSEADPFKDIHWYVYFLSFERSELEGKYAPIVLGRHSSTSTVHVSA